MFIYSEYFTRKCVSFGTALRNIRHCTELLRCCLLEVVQKFCWYRQRVRFVVPPFSWRLRSVYCFVEQAKHMRCSDTTVAALILILFCSCSRNIGFRLIRVRHVAQRRKI